MKLVRSLKRLRWSYFYYTLQTN